jgi:uncharacterized protein (TIGR02117 family)
MLVLARPIHVLASVLILFWTSSPSAASTIYVARRGWHIDVGMEVSDLTAPLGATAAQLPGARYLFFGFGDRHYLAAKKHNAPVLLSAIWPGGGIVLITALSASPGEAFGANQVTSLIVTAEQMQALQSFIWRSLKTQNGELLEPLPGPYEDSLYFIATAKYSALHTCNTWAAQALRAAGFHIHTAGIIFAGQLWRQVRRLEREERASTAASDGASLLKP